RSAPRGLGCAETGRERVLLAHIRTAPGLAVTSAAAGVVEAALLALQSSLHCLAVFCSAIADGDKASSPSNAAHTAKVGFITHLSGKTPPNACGLAATAPARRKLPRWQPQYGPRPLTGSVTIVRSLFLPCQEQRANSVIGNGGATGRRRRIDCRPIC